MTKGSLMMTSSREEDEVNSFTKDSVSPFFLALTRCLFPGLDAWRFTRWFLRMFESYLT